MFIKKILETTSFVHLSLKHVVTKSREVIFLLEEPFYRTSNPMGYAILTGIILGGLLFILVSGKCLFTPLH